MIEFPNTFRSAFGLSEFSAHQRLAKLNIEELGVDPGPLHNVELLLQEAPRCWGDDVTFQVAAIYAKDWYGDRFYRVPASCFDVSELEDAATKLMRIEAQVAHEDEMYERFRQDSLEQEWESRIADEEAQNAN